jgi:hypothetical protein
MTRYSISSSWLAVITVIASMSGAPELLYGQKASLSSNGGFRLFARSARNLQANRVWCPISYDGQLCADVFAASSITGAFWPEGTPNFHIWNSGLQIAGIIGSDGGSWAGDTTGAFFFDPKGTTQHGLGVLPIYASTDSADISEWPDMARVPTAPLYHPSLQGEVAASDEDFWWVMWEGNPAFLAGRPHPLGVLVEGRALAWNAPLNEDIVYFVLTTHNITSLDPVSYADAPPALQPTLLAHAQRFHDLNTAAFGISLPHDGYTITNLFAAISADPDVGFGGGNNYASVHLPLKMGYAWDHRFFDNPRWSFDPAIFSQPFFPGTGFVGIRLLGQPNLSVFSITENGGVFRDPQSAAQLYRYLSGTLSIAAGDVDQCNLGPPVATGICFVQDQRPFDMRFFLSAPPTDLAPGESRTFVVAYVFAAPHAIGACSGGAGCDIGPGDLSIIKGMGDPAVVAGGVNPVDSLAGFLAVADVDGDGVLSEYEFTFEPRSLYGKAQLAQAFFDNQFLTPTEPGAPDFFLVPGDGKVTVMWRPAPSEATGDPYFDVAKDATRIQPGGSVPTVNPLYDPNFRQFDVEGYRVYRGRVEDPGALTLIAQFDYAGTTISDFGGQVFGTRPRDCAPEVGITTECPVAYDPIAPGVTRTVHNDVLLNGPILQARFGDRIALSDGTVLLLRADTAAIPPLLYGRGLRDTGVPFVFVDSTARNSFRYFYSVTAFDLNSWQSGPSTLESSKLLKSITPSKRAVNYENTATELVGALYGRGVELCTDPQGPNPCRDFPVPDINPTTGTFSGPMPPADGWGIELFEFVPELFSGPGSAAVRLDSIQLGNGFWGNIPDVYWYTATSSSDQVTFSLSHLEGNLEAVSYQPSTSVSDPFEAVPIDPGPASRYGGDASYHQQGQIHFSTPGYYLVSGTGRSSSLAFNDGVANEALWDGSAWDGPRWFDGANETFPNPTGGNCQANCDMTVTGNFNNGGALSGVTTIHQPYSYTTMNLTYREFQGAGQGAQRAADMRVYWGTNGVVDSVVDLTHNVPIPFKPKAGGTWGFLNWSAQNVSPGSDIDDPTTLSLDDYACVAPFHAISSTFRIGCNAAAPFALAPEAELGSIGMVTSSYTSTSNYYGRTGTGFVMYLTGIFWMFETTALPADGAQWTLRDYAGGIYGGKGTDPAGNVVIDVGDYGFLSGVRPMTAVGAELRISWDVVNRVNQVTKDDLKDVHPVPDPYYFESGFDESAGRVIKFVNLPERAIIRIYSMSGVLVALLEHNSTTFGGEAEWNVRNRDGRPVASGVYFYHIESGGARRVGRMTVVSPSR